PHGPGLRLPAARPRSGRAQRLVRLRLHRHTGRPGGVHAGRVRRARADGPRADPRPGGVPRSTLQPEQPRHPARRLRLQLELAARRTLNPADPWRRRVVLRTHAGAERLRLDDRAPELVSAPLADGPAVDAGRRLIAASGGALAHDARHADDGVLGPGVAAL